MPGYTHVFIFFAKHIIVGRLFRYIHPPFKYSSRSGIYASLYDIYMLQYASSAWLKCAQFSFLNISESELIFNFLFIMDKGRNALVFLYILMHIFAINIIWFIRLVLTFPQFSFNNSHPPPPPPATYPQLKQFLHTHKAMNQNIAKIKSQSLI